MRSLRRDGDERAVGFGLIISAYLIRITRHDHRASPESGCVTSAITNVRSSMHRQTNPGQVPLQERNYTFSYINFFKRKVKGAHALFTVAALL